MGKAIKLWLIAALAIIALALMSCVPPAVVSTPTIEPVIIADDSLFEKSNKYAVTVCSWNNKAYVIGDTDQLNSPDSEGIILHEITHSLQGLRFRGGCNAFIRRYSADSAFKAQIEYEAYCVQGQFLLTRNRDPEKVWDEIRKILIYRYGVSNPKNCLYEEKKDDSNLLLPR